jgi:succinate-semialdehyde dehydrogenase / glutarate-semialdehyde dehydrogenase
MIQGYEAPYLLIGGQKINGGGRKTRPVLNPSTGEAIAELPCANKGDLDQALDAAAKAFRVWRSTPPIARSAVLRKAADLIRERSEAIARIMTLEQGKPLFEARMEVDWTAGVFDWQAEQGRRSYGRIIDSPVPGAEAKVVKEPVGPVAAFSPWNLPAFMPGRKIATALAAGCSIVIKPAEETPLTALKLGEALLDAGLPPGTLSIVYGEPSEISTYLIGSPIIRKVSFTGSTKVGRGLAALAGQHVKRVTMELGGHAPTILFDDADVDAAVDESAIYKFMNAGQICIAPTRFYVHEGLYDRFVERMANTAKSLRVGDGLSESTQMGPMSNSRRLDTMDRLVHDALQKGAELAAGGKRTGNAGFFFEPTVLSNVSETSTIMEEEPFGPVVVAASFADDDEVIARANRLPFGLGGFFYTKDVKRAHRVASELELGLVGVNTCLVALPEAPFGGVKESGFGSEGGIEGIETHLVTKFIHQI